MSFQKYSLWYATVLNPLLNDVEGVIVQVVVNYAFSESIIFIWVFHNAFLEVAIELQHLPVVLQPLGGYLWNCVVLLWPPLGDASKVHGLPLPHAGEQLLIDVLLETGGLLYRWN